MFCWRKRSEISGRRYENTDLTHSGCLLGSYTLSFLHISFKQRHWAQTWCLLCIAIIMHWMKSNFVFIPYLLNKKQSVHHNMFANDNVNHGSWVLTGTYVYINQYPSTWGFCGVVWSMRIWGIHCPNRARSSNPNIDSRWLKDSYIIQVNRRHSINSP